jgi:hypothetical protein
LQISAFQGQAVFHLIKLFLGIIVGGFCQNQAGVGFANFIGVGFLKASLRLLSALSRFAAPR